MVDNDQPSTDVVGPAKKNIDLTGLYLNHAFSEVKILFKCNQYIYI